MLETPSPTDGALAQELLASRGIPRVIHGPDRGSLAFGASANELTRPDLGVAKGAKERARVLDEARGRGARDGA